MNSRIGVIVFCCLLNMGIFPKGKSQAGLKDLTFGLGTITQQAFHVYTDSASSKNSFEFRPLLVAQGEYQLTDQFSLFPEFGFLWPGGARDPLISKMSYYLATHIGYKFGDFLFTTGLGLFYTRISSDGSTQELPNGVGVDAFPMPEQSSTSQSVTMHFGVDYLLSYDWSVRFDTSFYNIASGANRAFNYALLLNYHFHDSLWNDGKNTRTYKVKKKKRTKKKKERSRRSRR